MVEENSGNFSSLRPSQTTGRDPRDQKITRFFLIVVVLFLLFLTGFFFWHAYEKESDFRETRIEYLRIAGQNVKIDWARTGLEREKGLSGRKELLENQGMLFVFDTEGKYSFWMKDMNFPIDMIWLNKDLKIVDIKKNAMPESFPESFSPRDVALYVLEVPASFSDKNNLKIGDSASFVVAI